MTDIILQAVKIQYGQRSEPAQTKPIQNRQTLYVTILKTNHNKLTCANTFQGKPTQRRQIR